MLWREIVYELKWEFSLLWQTCTLKIGLENQAFTVRYLCPCLLNLKLDELQLLNAEDLNKSSQNWSQLQTIFEPAVKCRNISTSSIRYRI